MGRYITPAPSASHDGPVKKQQVFKTSGTFTPSQKLLDAGGVVTVRCVGGGGGGYNSSGASGGSSGMDVTRKVVVSAPVEVMIGAGGAMNQSGGATSFGIYLAASGGASNGASVGEGSMPGYAGGNAQTQQWRGRGGGIGGGVNPPHMGTAVQKSATNGVPNTGGGGASTSGWHPDYLSGGSGICIVTWEE